MSFHNNIPSHPTDINPEYDRFIVYLVKDKSKAEKQSQVF